MDGQQIRLRWTSHQGTVLSIFDVLLASESFVDVTLACEGQYIRAHRVILSACSPYFQKLLDVDTSKHPIFFLKDVKYTELKALVEYMYRGEVSIAHEELTSLLAVAQALMVRGLADVETTTNSISSDTIILPDIGSKRPVPKPTPLVPPITAVPSPPPMTPPAPAAPIVIPPSTVQLTRIVPTRPFPSATITSATVASATVSAPPVQKKPRLEPKLPPTTQVTQVQINTQAVDPLLDVHMPVLTPPVLDPLRPTASATTAGYCQASAVSENETFAQLEEPEVYGGQEVKIESDSLPVEVDLDEETQGQGENTMNQTNFSERFQLGEDNNLGKSEDPDPCGNIDEGAEAAGALTGGSDGEGINKQDKTKESNSHFVPEPGSIFDGSFFEVVSCKSRRENNGVSRRRVVAQCLQCNCILQCARSSNAVRHLKRLHPRSYIWYEKARKVAANEKTSVVT